MRRLVLTVLVVCSACPTRPVGDVRSHHDGEAYTELDVANRNLDILFVIDDSGSMEDEQAALIAAFPDFIDVLRRIDGGMPNLHIGVVTSDVGVGATINGACTATGDDGVLRNGAGGCGVAGRYISDVADPDGTRVTNYSGTLEEVFSCVANVGTNGCGFEQHLEAMRLAVDPASPSAGQNAGFLRDDAYLGVIFIADEDDCSISDTMLLSTSPDDAPLLGPLNDMRCVEFGVTCAEGTVSHDEPASYTGCEPLDDSPYVHHPDEYVAFLNQLRPVPHTVMVGGMTGNTDDFDVGDPDPDGEEDPLTLFSSCERELPDGTISTAEPGVRLRAFLAGFPPEDSTSASICDDPFRAVLLEIAAKMGDRFKPCLLGDVDVTDVDAAAPGLQLDCQVSDVSADQVERTLPRCVMTGATTPSLGDLPCWWTEIDAAACASTTTNVLLHVEREGTPPLGSRVVARCVTKSQG